MMTPSPNTRARRLWLALALVLCCAPAASAATQTFVSAKGDDAKPCEQDKPCRTIAGALLKTDVGGEVAVLDAGEYGPFTVSHSVKVTAGGGVYAGVTAVSGDAVHVASPSGSVVALRGLTITGKGGERGINYLDPGPSRSEVNPEAGVTLHVEGCTVSGFNDSGIAFHGQGSLFVKDTTVRGNGADGIGLRPASGVRVRASVVNCRLEKNMSGLAAYVPGGGEVIATARDTVAAGNKDVGYASTGPNARMQLQGCIATHQNNGVTAATFGRLTLEGCMLTNLKLGVWVLGGGRVLLSGTTITDNEVGLHNLQADPGHVYTFSNNRLFGNGIDAQGKPSLIAPQF
ncbi:MAG TPA: right-handed parallel beta-helix repeat-containing protein [Pyrinomonadaceae bacterium]